MLETNVVPGLTETSLLPLAADAAEIDSTSSSSGSWRARFARTRVTAVVAS